MSLWLLLFTQLFLKFKRSESRRFGRKRISQWDSHSRSFIFQSITGWQGIAYRRITSLALSLKFPKKKPPKSPKIVVVDNPTVIWHLCWEEPERVYAYALYFRKLESLGYILLLIVCAYLQSFSRFCLPNMRSSANYEKNRTYSSSRSSNVIDFGTNRSAYAIPISH